MSEQRYWSAPTAEGIERLLRLRAEAREQEARASALMKSLCPERGVLFLVDGGVLWYPDYFDIQCVAMTTKRERCKNPVFGGQEWHPEWFGPLVVPDSPTVESRLFTQLCSTHDDGRTDRDYFPTEWSFFRAEVTP